MAIRKVKEVKEETLKYSETILLEHNDDSLDISYLANKEGKGILTINVYERWTGDGTGIGQSANIYLGEEHAIKLYEFFKKIFDN